MSKDWVKIYSTKQIHKAEIAKAVLEDYGLTVFDINKMDSVQSFIPHGEIELYVDNDEVVKATHLISKNKL